MMSVNDLIMKGFSKIINERLNKWLVYVKKYTEFI